LAPREREEDLLHHQRRSPQLVDPHTTSSFFDTQSNKNTT